MNKNQGDARKKQLMRRFLVYLAVLAVLISGLVVYRWVKAGKAEETLQSFIDEIRNDDNFYFYNGDVGFKYIPSEDFIDSLHIDEWVLVKWMSESGAKDIEKDLLKDWEEDGRLISFSVSDIGGVYFPDGYAFIEYRSENLFGYYKVSPEIVDGISKYVSETRERGSHS